MADVTPINGRPPITGNVAGVMIQLSSTMLDLVDTEHLIDMRRELERVLTARGQRTPAPFNSDMAYVLSVTQATCFMDCSAKWWFKYGLKLPDPKTVKLALGIAVHRGIEGAFREKMTTGHDQPADAVVATFQRAWAEVLEDTELRDDENPDDFAKAGEALVRKYMAEAAPAITPAAVEKTLVGKIAGVQVEGRVDLIDTQGRVIDLKTAAARPSGISSNQVFQLATYRQLDPSASGEARIDTLVKTKTPQLVQQPYTITAEDVRSTEVIFPLVQESMRAGYYVPNRSSMLCSRRNCSFWRACQKEFGGNVEAA